MDDLCTFPRCTRAVVVMHNERPHCLNHWREVRA